MKHWLRNILILTLWLADRVMQPTGDVIAAEGDTVTLDCTFETSYSNPTLFWYKQDGNNNPKFILSCSQFGTVNTEKKYEERFSSKVNATSNSVPLKIQKLQLSDSAVYYCALQPTVTGNTKTLYKNLWSKDNTILHNIH
uniref:Ig-like domain-containing protein n=1 Tax=Sparus aurata TaxID=8175 RepID=A0A671U0R4_SPAAU